jgi:hypothetical protein
MLMSWADIGGAVGSVWGPVGTAVGSVAGGLLDNSLNNQNNDRNENAYRHRIQWTVEDAKRAGINPLAALGNATYSPTFTSGSDIHGNVGNAVARSQANQLRAQELEVQKTKNEAEIAHWNSIEARNRAMANSSPSLELVPPQATTRFPNGWETDKTRADAQTYEDRYGELGGALAGIVNAVKDMTKNFESYKKREGGRTTSRGTRYRQGPVYAH